MEQLRSKAECDMLSTIQRPESRSSTTGFPSGPVLFQPRSSNTPVPLHFQSLSWPGWKVDRLHWQRRPKTLGSHRHRLEVPCIPSAWESLPADVHVAGSLVALSAFHCHFREVSLPPPYKLASLPSYKHTPGNFFPISLFYFLPGPD